MTQDELKQFKDILEQQKKEIIAEIEKRFDLKLSAFPTKDELDEKLRLLPTREEFFNKMDELMGEIKASREEQTLQVDSISEHSDQLDDHEERIKKIEKIVNPSVIV